MSIFTTRTAITAGAVAVAVVLSIGGVAVAQASIGQFDDTTAPTGVPSPTSTLSDDGPLHDLNDDNGGLRPDGVSDDGPLHDLNDDNGGLGEDESDDDGDSSGHGSDDGVDNSGHGNAEDAADDNSGSGSGSGEDNSGHGNSDDH